MHTTEPWRYHDGFIVGKFSDGTVHDICDPRCAPVELADEMDDNAERIIHCVNACAGIDDPAATLAEVRKELAKALSELHNEDECHPVKLYIQEALTKLGKG